eukprot:CAMPEP_0115626554 /NCGR_PEP_ID=MMETSP0272-20121206/28408_1 /TAXON_ID=71861 /ORGANISM="Scrippsiella trochoidea, Strain CCMP3099" /LENGTH=153 /DNA_ID=CAMNT_0003062921 /DNA_START=99 /DNA_END=560 /DNA_ORIENTATION=-
MSIVDLWEMLRSGSMDFVGPKPPWRFFLPPPVPVVVVVALRSSRTMSIVDLWEMLRSGSMDFVGQKQAFDFQYYIIWIAGIIGFIYGFIQQRFLYTFYFIFGATMFVTAVCLPSWPWWNRNPVKWLEPKEEPKPKEAKEDKKKGGGKKDKKKE